MSSTKNLYAVIILLEEKLTISKDIFFSDDNILSPGFHGKAYVKFSATLKLITVLSVSSSC